MMTYTRIAVALLALGCLMLAPGEASAQVGTGPGSAYTRGGNAKFDTRTSAPVAKALPGARGVGSRVAPSERAAADMKPTEALFDAVNRGDMSAARDAISRGAEIAVDTAAASITTTTFRDQARTALTGSRRRRTRAGCRPERAGRGRAHCQR